MHGVYLGFRGGQAQTEDSAAAQSLQSCVEQDIICGPFFTQTHAQHLFRTSLMHDSQIVENIPKLKTLSRDNMVFGGSRPEEFVFPSFTITHLCCYRAIIPSIIQQIFQFNNHKEAK